MSGMNPAHPDVLPIDAADRRAWRRYWLPGISAKALRDLTPTYAVRHQLTDEKVDRLLAFYVHEEIHREVSTRYGDLERLVRWLNEVLRIDVALKLGGFAILRDPLESYRVEIAWLQVGRTKELQPKWMRVIADESLGLNTPNLLRYFAAFFVRTSAMSDDRAFTRSLLRSRPAAGRSPDTGWYRDLLAQRDALILAGERAPAKVIGERMGENATTVRSWFRRAEIYLDTDREET